MQDEQPPPIHLNSPIDEPAGTPPLTESATQVVLPPPTVKRMFHAELQKKQRRPLERAIEVGIFSVATISIVAIFLIFFFVFKEAAPIFFGSSSKRPDTLAAATNGSATAKADSAKSADNSSDVYNPGTGTIPSDTDSSKAVETSSKKTATSTPPADTSEIYNPSSGAIAAKDSAEAANVPPVGTGGPDSSETQVYNPETGSVPAAGSATDSAAKGGPVSTTSTPAPPIAAADTAVRSGEAASQEAPVKPSYLLHSNWQPTSVHPKYGILPIVEGTIKTTVVALVIAVPLAILAALFTAFFAPKWVQEYVKPGIELLAGFPSVVLGFFCLMNVATWIQSIFHIDSRLNAVVGGIGLSLAVIPIIYTLTEDALRSVPKSLREAALALGASEWQAAYQIMLPAATPGIFAAILLGLGRAVGETMIVLMATGNASTVGMDFFESVRTFAATIGAEMGEVVVGSPHYQVLFLLGALLFVFSFLLNFVTEFYIKARLVKRFRGSE